MLHFHCPQEDCKYSAEKVRIEEVKKLNWNVSRADVALWVKRKITSKLDILCSEEFHKYAKTNLM